MTAKLSEVIHVSGMSATVTQRCQRMPRVLMGTCVSPSRRAHTNMLSSPLPSGRDIPWLHRMETRAVTMRLCLVRAKPCLITRALAHDYEEVDYAQILNARPEDFVLGYNDPFLSQEPQYTGRVEFLDSDIPLLTQAPNEENLEIESLLPQLDDLGTMSWSQTSLDDSQYLYSLIEQATAQDYAEKIGETEVKEAWLDDQKVKSQCELERLRMIVAAKEREKKAGNQLAPNEGSASGP